MAISAAFAGIDMGPESRRSTRTSEVVAITGSTGIAGDTTTYRCRHSHKNAQILGGAFAISASSTDLAGVTVTIKSVVALGDDVVHIEITGEP